MWIAWALIGDGDRNGESGESECVGGSASEQKGSGDDKKSVLIYIYIDIWRHNYICVCACV